MSRDVNRYELEKEVREGVREWAEDNPDNTDIDYDGSLSQLVDSAVPIYTSDLFQLAADNWEFRQDDSGIAGDDADCERIIQAAVYNWLYSHAWDEWTKVEEEREEAELA